MTSAICDDGSDPSAVGLEPGETVTCVFTNTKQQQPTNGSLEMTKVVDWKDVTPDIDQTFEICISGPSHPAGDCEIIDYAGGTLTWSNLIPGDYTVTETDPGSAWTASISGSPATVVAGQTAQASVTNAREVLLTCPSITAKSENVEVLDYIPTDVGVQAFESDDYVRVWKEFEGTLATDLAYDLDEDRIAITDGPSSSSMAIPADTDVCVYYIHLDNVGLSGAVQKTGFLEYATDISGLIISGGSLGTFVNKNLMFAADDQIGYSGTTYPDDSTVFPPNFDYLRGFDVNYPNNLDDAWFNGARVDFTMWVGNAHDSFRVILPLVP